MGVKLLTEHHLKFLSLKGGCTGSSDSTRVKMPHCWKSHIAAQLCEASKDDYILVMEAELVKALSSRNKGKQLTY